VHETVFSKVPLKYITTKLLLKLYGKLDWQNKLSFRHNISGMARSCGAWGKLSQWPPQQKLQTLKKDTIF